MATGKGIERRGHVAGFKEEIDKAAQDDKDVFFSWFNTAKNVDEAFIRGQWDFIFHIAHPLSQYISHPENLTALEIGHGGGRILAAASKSFGNVIGVDIHGQNTVVSDELHQRGYGNFELRSGNGYSIPVLDSTVDVVYSFIVLQHIEKIEYFQKYVEEAFRVLLTGGIAVLYFGRYAKFSIGKESKTLFNLDKLLEEFVLRDGYREIPAAVNDINLLISLRYAKKIAIEAGFEVLGSLVSRRKVPDGSTLFGLQNGLVIRKQ